MHWFDRFSKQVATGADARNSRRTVIKGAALATAVLPFAPQATTYAANRVRQNLAANTCLLCFSEATKNNAQGNYVKACLQYGLGKRSLLAPKGGKGGGGKKGGGKKPPKSPEAMKPAPAAKQTSCEADARKLFLFELNLCRTKICSNPVPPEVVPSPTDPEGGSLACPSGTTKCAGMLCCYGGDACCGCPGVDGGSICCAGVIGCTCC